MAMIWKVLTRKKVIDPASAEQSQLSRVLNIFDLTALGVGSTLGVGVYVLAGHVARDIAGPAVILSFLLAAIASVFAGLCYAEFGARAPRAGSAYIYSYVCIGEFIAFVIGWNLILEYVIGSASVARGLSLYLDTLINNTLKDTFREIAPINVPHLSQYFDFFAFGISILLATALAFGLKESSLVNNIFTVINIFVVGFVIIAGSLKADPGNWSISPDKNDTNATGIGNGGFFPFGVEGMIRGAATCFYGFVGFDCIATTAEEVKNPKRAIPISIILSLFIIFLAYFGTSTVITLMVPYYLQNPDAPIPYAFEHIGWYTAKWIVSIGGIFGLCASLFGAMFPLPRIVYAMASDSLVFKFLGKVHSRFQTPVIGTLLAGLLTGLMAALFDLSQLVNMMSIGTLLAYTIVAASVLLLRYTENKTYNNSEDATTSDEQELLHPPGGSVLAQIFNCGRYKNPTKTSETIVAFEVFIYCIICVLMGLCAIYLRDYIGNGEIWAIVITSIVVFIAVVIIMSIVTQPTSNKELSFKVPLVPLIPALSILVNIYLMLMLDIHTWIRFAVWMAVGKDDHDFILSLVGPEWYQELSPNQLRTVDQLQCCILTDIKNKSITNVQENIGQLGLVLRPNHRHIAKALRLCCKDPIEFLLILYQIMNPNRKEYNLNDRLLLSAVVHLCMTETLRELHVRIPSPPVEKNVTTTKPKVKKKIKYASPYLEPLMFTPVPPKHTGRYENPHIQWPENPYFSYLKTLAIDRGISDDIFELDLTTLEPEEAELLKDMRQAQLMYDDITEGERVNLLKPTIWKQCKDVAKFYKSLCVEKPKSLTLPPLSTLDDSDEEECFCSEVYEESCKSCEHDSISYECECEEVCNCKNKSKIFTSSKCKGCLARERKKYVQRVIKGITITEDNVVVPIIEGTVLHKTCDCLQKYRENIIAIKARNNLRRQKVKYVIGGVAVTKEGPVYILSAALKKVKKQIIINPNLSEFIKQKEKDDTEKQSQSLEDQDNIKKFENKDRETVKQGGAYLECVCRFSKYERSTNTEAIEENAVTCEKYEDDSEEMTCDCEDCKCKEKSKIYTGSRCKKCQEKERQKYIERIIAGLKETASHKIVPIIEGTRLLDSCDCLQKYAERILSMEARNKIQSQNAQFIVGGVAFTKEGPVYILSTALLRRKDTCRKICRTEMKKIKKKKPVPVEEEAEEEEEEEDLKYSGCKCKQELDRFLNHKCTCEECNVRERHAEGITYIMGGAMSNDDDGTVNVVQGVYQPRCDCLEKYMEKINKLEDYRSRIEAKYNLKSQTLKYSIGGVVSTPNGPVYLISGMRPPVDCECAKAARRKEEEELHSQQMAKMPPTGRIKYQIAGVRQCPEGNVFVISQALAIDDCECVKLYDTYIQAHKVCLDIYENFLEQTNKALEEYKSEVTNNFEEEITVSDVTEYRPQIGWSEAVVGASNLYPQNSFSNYNLFEKGEVVRAMEPTCPGQKLNICARGEVVSLSGDSLISRCSCLDQQEDDETSSQSSVESLTCADTCVQDSRNDTVAVEKKESVQVEKKLKSKRFVILKKIPNEPKKQFHILKKVLATMAEDGFPLAKLPDCHKLPHFKLWMQLRCGKFWRQKDIDFYELYSKKYWAHTDICPMEFKLPNTGISVAKARTMTWENANYIKKILHNNVQTFYRQISQKTVEKAREFFPISYSYEFPNKTFRDTFFAYMPSKEKDTLAFRILKLHDIREISKKYSCYR